MNILGVIEQKRCWHGHVKRMPEERLSKLTTEWVPAERRKRERPKKTWLEGAEAANEIQQPKRRPIEKSGVSAPEDYDTGRNIYRDIFM